MSDWRRQALELVPLGKRIIEEADSEMEMWGELCSLLFEIYGTETVADNEATIQQIYTCALLCLGRAVGGRLKDYNVQWDYSMWSAVTGWFWKDVFRNKSVKGDLHNHLSLKDFDHLESTLCEFLSDKEAAEFKNQFYRAKGKMPKGRM